MAISQVPGQAWRFSVIGTGFSCRNMYPYYDTFARELVCHRMRGSQLRACLVMGAPARLSGMNLLIIYTLAGGWLPSVLPSLFTCQVVSLILMPCVALLADVDLRSPRKQIHVLQEAYYHHTCESYASGWHLGMLPEWARKWERYKMNNYEQHYDMKCSSLWLLCAPNINRQVRSPREESLLGKCSPCHAKI